MINDDQAYFRRYKHDQCMMMDPVLTAFIFKRCMNIHWEKSTKNGSVRYDYISGEGFRLKEESLQFKKRAGGSLSSYTAIKRRPLLYAFEPNRD